MEKVVISGINIFQAGALSIYKEFLDTLCMLRYEKKYEIIIFVHRYELFKEYREYFHIIEIPKSRKNYLYRMYYEYIFFYFYSRKDKIKIWISLHDITPNVIADKRYVYCHNPLPFFNIKNIKSHVDFKLRVIQKLYKFVYQINIKRNTAVIVQQEWIRKEFRSMFGLKNIIVARPGDRQYAIERMKEKTEKGKFIFIYPAYPRVFKNFEVICEAGKKLADQRRECEIWLTLDGSENAYSKLLRDTYDNVENIKWCGLLSKEKLEEAYASSDCLIFSSLLETWGLPITEYKKYGKPIICADLPYAHETIGEYKKVNFFDPSNQHKLTELMSDYVDGKIYYDKNPYVELTGIEYQNWHDLITAIFE